MYRSEVKWRVAGISVERTAARYGVKLHMAKSDRVSIQPIVPGETEYIFVRLPRPMTKVDALKHLHGHRKFRKYQKFIQKKLLAMA